MLIIARRVNNFPTNVGISRSFRSRLMGQHLSDASRDLATLTLTLEVTALVADTGLRALFVYQVRRPFRSVRYWADTVLALIRLVTLTFDLLTSK